MEPIKVMYIEVSSPAESKDAFDKLESRFPSLKGRKFYGVAFGDKYWAAVKIESGDDPAQLGLQEGEIPGGEYAKEVIPDWVERVAEIKPAFDRMAEVNERDVERPAVEFYKSQKELQLWFPKRGNR